MTERAIRMKTSLTNPEQNNAPGRARRLLGYGAAAGMVVLTFWLRLALASSIGDRPVLILFVIPIILSAYVGGLGPGLFSTTLVALGTDYFLIPPTHSFSFDRPVDFAQWLILILAGVLISVQNEQLHRARAGREQEPVKAWNPIGLPRLLLALLPPLAAVLVQRMFWPFFQPFVWFLFYPAVFFSSWIGGLPGGVAATALATTLVIYFFIPPEFSFAVENARTIPSVGVFVGMGVLFSFFHDRLRKESRRATEALAAASAANDRLEARVRERTAELTRSNESLLRSEAQLQTVVENLTEGVAVSDADGRLLHFNRAALDMHGFASRNEYLRRLPEFADTFELSALDGTVWPVDQWPLTRILRGETLRDLEVHIRRIRTDWQRIFSYGGALVRDTDGKPLLAVVTMRDITERRQAERRLRQQLEHLSLLDQITRSIGERLDLQSIFQVVIRTLEDSLPIDFGCVCIYDEPANALKVARVGVKSAALAMELALAEGGAIGVDENGLGRCMGGRLVYEADLSQVRSPFPERLARGGLRSLVMAPLRSESRVFGVLVAARREVDGFSSVECEFLRQLSEHVALAAGQAQLHGALQQAYDDLRATQQAVMQEERLRALGQMASGIAHDINNALSPVSLYADLLLEKEANLSDRARRCLEIIQRAVEDVAQTVARLREFYRQREPQLELAPVDVNQLVQQVLDLTRARWSDMPQQHGIAIRPLAELAPGLPKIMGVESEIREALTNLVFNAVDAMPGGGTLTLRTRLADAAGGLECASVVIEVADDGVGMDEDTRRRCLDPFFTTKGERGTGLGLAMVFGTVQRHSADLEIESTPGAGTTVRLIFAVPAAVAAEPGQPAKTPQAPSRLRLLLIDDDPVLLESLRSALETDGHAIATANSGAEGISTFRAALDRGETFAAVITDLGMPYVDGRKVAAAVKEASPSTPVILLTGWGQRLVAEGDIPPHVDRVLAKPPKLRELREAFTQLCRAAA